MDHGNSARGFAVAAVLCLPMTPISVAFYYGLWRLVTIVWLALVG